MDTSRPNVEPAYSYGFVAPVAADILSQAPNTYSPSYSERYFMSLFGPRYKSVSSSNIGFFDFHKGMDVTAAVTSGGVDYDENTPPMIVSRCDGEITEIEDGPDAQMESTGEGRYVEVRCDQQFSGNQGWGHIYMAYRHLDTIAQGLQIGARIDQGDDVGVMGESGHTSTVHLHYSVMRHDGQRTINVNPMRTFDPAAYVHLHAPLADAEIAQLNHDLDSALFRVTLPYQSTAIMAVKVRLLNSNYERSYDFESISENAGDFRDNNDYVDGLELFAYAYNRGQSAYRRYLDKMDDMPQPYPASPENTAQEFRPLINNDMNTTPAYVLDVRVRDLPLDFDVNDLEIEIIDIYGHGVRATGDSAAQYPSIVFARIEDSDDDAEESDSGNVDLSSSDLELVEDGSKGAQVVGLRFPDLGLPQGVSIEHAHVQFSADETDDEFTDLTVQAEDVDSSVPFSEVDFDLSQRSLTMTSVNWNPLEWSQVNETRLEQATPNLAPVLQQVVNRPGWNEQSALSLMVTGSGKRVADSANGSAHKDPYLYVEYSNGAVANLAPQVQLLTPADNDVVQGFGAVSLTASAADADGGVSVVRFYVDNVEVGMDMQAPYELDWFPPGYGQFTIHAEAEDDLGELASSDAASLSIVGQQVVIPISSGNDDVEERESGSIARNGSDLELGYDSYVSSTYGLSGHQTVGLRFTDVPVPAGAIISRAYIQFTSKSTSDDDVNLSIEGEYSGDASAFSYSSFDVSGRTATQATVHWSPDAWTAVDQAGEAQQTPDLSAIVQEIVDHNNWMQGSALMLRISAEDDALTQRNARSYNGNSNQAPQLVIEYSL
ncbi:M23 family metallopeptidase [Pseudomaricurvus alkylphenolicus]|uniref:Ig-like domain-containing protein n=1 Tax=Pseudomaricurvus alkylphenolicus TaxID=1306991 RepID=UPI0014232312|nr:M23 family metallopeptidase [Pseudomaricurvus alkylphenolicus]